MWIALSIANGIMCTHGQVVDGIYVNSSK
jgi:hypothetical protein